VPRAPRPERPRAEPPRREERPAPRREERPRGRRRDDDDGPPVVGMGDHVPSFLLRPVKLKPIARDETHGED
jgi:hypothetical protein